MFLINFLLFLFLSLIFFTIPGYLVLKKASIKDSLPEMLALSTVVGFILYTLLSFTLNILGIHQLIIFYFLLNVFFFMRYSGSLMNFFKSFKFVINASTIITLIVFSLGITGQMLVIAPSGININGDILFWSAHGHDGPWHIALAQEIQKGFPLQNPVFGGEKLVNYHFFSDITIADFNKYFKLSLFDLYFRYFPFLFSILLGGSAFIVGKLIGKSFSAGILAAFFTYFAGSFGFIVTFIRDQQIGGEGLFWSSQVQSTIGNPPQIIASIIILTFLFFFKKLTEEKSINLFIICTVLASSLSVFKVYGSIVLLSSLGIVGAWELLRNKSFRILLLTLISGLVSAALYLPFSSNSGSFLIYEPGWFIRTMIVAEDKLDWLDLELRKQTYLAEGNLKRVIHIHLIGFSIFLFGNLGMRFIGFWDFIKLVRNAHKVYFNQLILFILMTSLLIPMIYLQRGVAANTIQFLQYFLLIMGILAGVTTASVLKLAKVGILQAIIIIMIFILAVPTQVGLIYSFYKRPAYAQVSRSEITTLNLLKQVSDKEDLILTPPYDKYHRVDDPTPPTWAWFDTAYVSALSGRRTYLSDTEQVDIMGYDFKERLKIQEEIFKSTDPQLVKELLQKTNAKFIYFPKKQHPLIKLSDVGLVKIYENDLTEIWKID